MTIMCLLKIEQHFPIIQTLDVNITHYIIMILLRDKIKQLLCAVRTRYAM